MAINTLGPQNPIQVSWIGNLTSKIKTGIAVAAVAVFGGCESEPSKQYRQYYPVCENFLSRANPVLGNEKLDEQQKKESLNRLAWELNQFIPMSAKAQAMREITNVALQKISGSFLPPVLRVYFLADPAPKTQVKSLLSVKDCDEAWKEANRPGL